MRVTEYYGISGPVPFLNVNVHRDNRLFVDPRAIRLASFPQPYADTARTQLTTFFDTVAGCVLSANPVHHARGLGLLRGFGEPWETRLGLAERGYQGHGGAEKVGAWIWETLDTNVEAFFRIGVLTQVEDIPLFVTGVAEDITSDLTTRIVYESLASFTADVLSQYPQFTQRGHRTRKQTRRVWNGSGWEDKQFTLPIADERSLLLVPRDWARHSLLMGARRYYDRTILDYHQELETVYLKDDQVLKPRKRDLRERQELSPSRPMILSTTLAAAQSGRDLVRQFKTLVDNEHQPLSEELLQRKTR